MRRSLFRFFTALLLLQVVHLVWLTFYLLGVPFPDTLNVALAIVDYTELPAIFGLVAMYVTQHRRFTWHSTLLLSQLIHIFWITDDVIINATEYPVWLALIAAGIDYLEIPVMVSSMRQAFRKDVNEV